MKVKMHDGVYIGKDGTFYAYCPYCLGTSMDGQDECTACDGAGSGYELSKHPNAFPVDLERDYYADMSMDVGAATEWYNTTDGIG